MFGNRREERLFLEKLCEEYYEKILRYLYGVLGDESAARDCAQDVFLTACQKSDSLRRHPNPGGFLFQTAKNLARKSRRLSFSRLLRELPAGEDAAETADPRADVEAALDERIDETEYIETILSQLSEEKRRLYSLYYLNGNTMAQVAAMLGLSETAARMRYVRLRREIRGIITEVAARNFSI